MNQTAVVMDTQTQKLALISWIIGLNDPEVLQRLATLKKLADKATEQADLNKRKFGWGKGIFTYVSDDFNEPLDDFKEYMP